MNVVGVDGCKMGWIAVVWDTEAGTLTHRGFFSLRELIASYPDTFIGIDIPIGLSDQGDRTCDKAARKMLGRPRGSSVFPPPIPSILHLETYAEASAASRDAICKGISQQSFALFSKLNEANETITPAIQDRVFEVHPEVSFCQIAGHPLVNPKRDRAGYSERRDLLNSELNLETPIPEREVVSEMVRDIGAKPDDYLDAAVAAWTARRVAEGSAQRFPEDRVVRGSQGLRMEIVY